MSKPETFTQKLLRYLEGLRPHTCAPTASDNRWDDQTEAVDAVKSIAFAFVALDFDEAYREDAVAGWLTSPKHATDLFQTEAGIASLAALYLEHARKMQARVADGSLTAGGMRCQDAARRLAQHADEGAKQRVRVWTAAHLSESHASARPVAGNDNGRAA